MLEKKEKAYFYYPSYNKNYSRRVVAGIIHDNKLYLSEAVCFTGSKEKPSDQFVKKLGRQIAESRAQKAVSGCTKCASHIIDIPENTGPLLGKFFVSSVENLYPKHVRKTQTV